MTDANTNTELKQQQLSEGHSAFDSEDYMGALEHYHRASLLDSADPAVWVALGLAFSNLEFPREAWRSYFLALSLDSVNADALWYAAEFLFQHEDLALADFFLSRYMAVEQDRDKLEDAQSLRSEMHAEAAARGISLAAERGEEAAAFLAADTSSAVQEQLEQPETTEEAEVDSAEFQLSDEELEAQALAGETGFVAPLSLRLSGFEGECQHCQLRIPWDAPYCYSCKMIHFYE